MLFLYNCLEDTERTDDQPTGPTKMLKQSKPVPTNISVILTKADELRSGQKDSGMGQNPTAKPFCAERGT
jgi:hypothetical protein